MFLGNLPEDNNYADFSIGLSISENLSFIIYNNCQLKLNLNLEDDLVGVFDNDEKFILSIPFDVFKYTENKEINTFASIFKDNEIDFQQIKSNSISFQEFGILFNEK